MYVRFTKKTGGEDHWSVGKTPILPAFREWVGNQSSQGVTLGQPSNTVTICHPSGDSENEVLRRQLGVLRGDRFGMV